MLVGQVAKAFVKASEAAEQLRCNLQEEQDVTSTFSIAVRSLLTPVQAATLVVGVSSLTRNQLSTCMQTRPSMPNNVLNVHVHANASMAKNALNVHVPANASRPNNVLNVSPYRSTPWLSWKALTRNQCPRACQRASICELGRAMLHALAPLGSGLARPNYNQLQL